MELRFLDYNSSEPSQSPPGNHRAPPVPTYFVRKGGNVRTAKLARTDDQQIRESVLREIEWQHEVTSKEVSVEVHNHIVTLTGFAHGYIEKLAAERAAKCVYGVKDVVNHLEVKPGLAIADAELLREATQALQRNFTVPDTRIEVTVKDGEIVLEGNVDRHFQKQAAEEAVQDLTGAKSISNRIVVSASVPARDVRTKIEEALRRRADVDSRRIVVLGHNGTVELRGSVRSWAEKDEAAAVARAAAGVTEVENKIVVVP